MTGREPDTWSVRSPVAIGVTALLFLIGGFGSWAALTSLSGAIIVPGQIEVERNRQIVQHPDGGVVATILVEEGMTVKKGALLLRLDETLLKAQSEIIQGQRIEMLARLARLEAERDEAASVGFSSELLETAERDQDVQAVLDGQRRLYGARTTTLSQQHDQLSKRIAQITNQIEGIDAQKASLQEQSELVHAELVNQKTLLDRGLAQASKVSSLRRELARIEGQIGEVVAARAEAEGRAIEIEIEALQLRSRARETAIEQLRDMQAQVLELTEKQEVLRKQLKRLDITAPVSGVVYGLSVFAEKSVVRPAEPILYVVPQDRPLVISTRIEPIHIDQVTVGQRVELRLSAFNANTTPELEGRVVRLSPDSFFDEATQQNYYRAEVVFLDGQTELLAEGQTLIPGMPVDAYFRTEDRSPMAYLLQPLSDYFTKAFRDS